MKVEFTAHNVRLNDGTYTNPDIGYSIDNHPWFLSAKRMIETVFPGDKKNVRLADLGCLEGGYAAEFARMGLDVLGVEIRDSNLAACRYIQENTNLPNLKFAKDDAWNIGDYGEFDVVFCCGLLYHLDKPKKFLEQLSKVTAKMLIVQTHFAVTDLVDELNSSAKFGLTEVMENESAKGRWFVEFSNESEFKNRENTKWASWDNYKSFWLLREELLQTIKDVGFDMVLEQFDSLTPHIADSMLKGYYKTDSRGTFIGVKTN